MEKLETIKSRRDFVNIQHNYDKKFYCNSVVILYKQNNLNKIRCGYVATKKIDKRAVIRNKIKRRLREISRYFYKNKIFKNNYDYEFIAKKEFLNYSFNDIKNEIYNLLK